MGYPYNGSPPCLPLKVIDEASWTGILLVFCLFHQLCIISLTYFLCI